MTHRRFDAVGRLDAKRRTPQGGLRVDANLTRTGVFIYKNDSGQEVREYRSAEEVFKADSLATLKQAPLTIGHAAMVTPDNWQKIAVGTIADDVRADGKFVKATASVQDRKTIEAIERGDLVEVSCGYTVDLVQTPGVTPDGERYDAVQTNISYNHVAIGREGWGRGGGEVRLRLDGNGDVVLDEPAPTSDGMLTAEQEKARADKAEADLKTATTRADKAEGERDAEKTRADKAEADAAKARTDAKQLDVPALVAARTALETSARKVLGGDATLTIKEDGKDERPMTDAELVTAVIAKDDKTFKVDGKSSDYLRARFDTIVERTAKSDDAHRQVGNAIVEASKNGVQTKDKIDEAIEKRDAARNDAAKAGAPLGAVVRT